MNAIETPKQHQQWRFAMGTHKLIAIFMAIFAAAASAADTFQARADLLLWAPDPDKFPGLQVQVPEVVKCPSNDENCPFTNKGGWWWGYKSEDEAKTPQFFNTSENKYVDWEEGVGIADPDDGTPKIGTEGLKVKLQIGAVAEVGEDEEGKYPVAGIAFHFKNPETQEQDIEAGKGYYIEYSSDGEIILEMRWNQNTYSYNTFRFTLPATDGAQYYMMNIPWKDFTRWDDGGGNKNNSYKNATGLGIVIQSNPGDAAKNVEFTLKKLGWYRDFPSNPPTVSATYKTGKLKDAEPPLGYWWAEDTENTTMNAGNNQKFDAVFTDDNGTSAFGKITVNVAKAAGNTASDYSAPSGLTVTYGQGQTLASASLPAKWAWKSPTTSSTLVGDAGTHTYTATFTSGNTNYNPYDAVWTVNVQRKDPVLADLNYSIAAATYNGSSQGITTPTLKSTSGTGLGIVTVKYRTKGTAANTAVSTAPTNAGTYTVSVSIAQGTNFNATATDIDLTGDYVINKASGLATTAAPNLKIKYDNTTENTFDLTEITLNKTDLGTPVYSLGKFTDGTGDKQILTAAPTLETDGKTLKYTGNGKSSSSATQVIKIESDNYQDINVTITFEATDKTIVTISGLEAATDLVYDGTAKQGYTGTATSGSYTGDLVYTYKNGSGSTVTEAKNAGNYTLVVSIPENPEYTANTYSIGFTIEKATGSTVTALATANLAATANSITVNTAPTISTPATGQTVEYAKNTNSTLPTSGWQNGTAFTGLAANTDYYIFARSKESENYKAGTAVSASSKTLEEAVKKPVIATTSLPNGKVGVYYGQVLDAGDFATWSLASGDLPPGLNLDSDGYIYGTPTRAVTYEFTVKATNDAGSDTKRLTIAIASSGSGGGYTTPVLSKAETGNKAVHIANGLNLSVSSGAAVGIYGLKGNLVQSQSYASGEHTMSLNNLPKGMYIVKVSFRNRENTISHSDVMRVMVK
jgi:hypothetical protein